MRLFTAVVLPDDVVAELDAAAAPHRDEVLAWTHPEQWHITLAFYGQVEDARVPELKTRLTRAAKRYPVLSLALDGAGRFDKVFGIHYPPLLRGDPARELAEILDRLVPGGTLHVIFQPFTTDQVDRTIERVTAGLDANGLRVERVDRRAASPAAVVSVVARPG